MNKKIFILVSILLLAVIGFFLFRMKNLGTVIPDSTVKDSAVIEELGNRFTSNDAVLKTVPQYLSKDSTNEERGKFTDLAFKSAISTTTISFNGCLPDVAGVKASFDDVLVLSNVGTSSIKIKLGQSDLSLSAGDSAKLKAADVFPGVKDFSKSRFVKIYNCEGAIGPVGYIVSGK